MKYRQALKIVKSPDLIWMYSYNEGQKDIARNILNKRTQKEIKKKVILESFNETK